MLVNCMLSNGENGNFMCSIYFHHNEKKINLKINVLLWEEREVIFVCKFREN
jgi:hypothetical protein